MQSIQKKVSNSVDDDDNDDEEFFDATSDIEAFSAMYEMDLSTALDDAKVAICYFFNNNFEDARNLMKPYVETSMYHAMGNATFTFLEAILTFEQQHIAKASEELKKCLEVCQRHRKKNTIGETIGKRFGKTNYANLTDEEAHAELCMAETGLLKALLTFIEDESLSSFLRGGIKIRNCYNSYKECAVILQQRQWETEKSRVNFESGVRMGMGTFNLMISLLPAGIIRFLEFIGFSGNKALGLQDLHIGYELVGMCQALCGMTLLGYHLIVCYVLSHQDGDLVLCESILKTQLKKYPNGVWFLFFKGRLEFMKGNLDEAVYYYKKSWKSQNIWEQFHHLSFWELLWLHCLKLDWREASLYATYLLEHSKWSRTIYSYQKAAVMLMLKNLTSAEKTTIDTLMSEAPGYKQRIAGKSLPMEKFICKKAVRYFAQNKMLCLPAIELMYIWNTFKVLSKNHDLAAAVLQVIDSKTRDIEELKSTVPFGFDNYALCLLLRGACNRQMKNSILALKDLEDCIALQQFITEDTYIIAYANVEIGLVHIDENRLDEAIATLEDCKKKYSGYSLESRLHFRIHAALTDLKEKQNSK